MKTKRILIIGGGIAGMQAALDLAEAGAEIVLAEKESQLGGHVAGFASLFPHGINGGELARKMIDRLSREPGVITWTATEINTLTREGAGFVATMKSGKETFDAVLLATGYDNFAAERYGEYGYRRYPNIITGSEFEQRWPELAKQPLRTVVFVKCVGARDRSKGMPYCSKVCCMYTAKQAAEIRDTLPNTQVYVFYMDIRANFPGGEEYVRGVMENRRVRYIRGRVAKIFPRGSRLTIRAEDTLMGVPLELEADLVVLASAMVASTGAADIARQLGGTADEHGFFARFDGAQVHPMSIAPGLFYAGACGFPTDARDALIQGSAAAAGIAAYLQSGGRDE